VQRSPLIKLFIDNGVWDQLWLLCRNHGALKYILPPQTFDLWITREQQLEIPVNDPLGKEGLRAFILDAIDTGQVKVEVLFGFDDSNTPADRRRYGGFDEGTWAPPAVSDYYAKLRATPPATKMMNSGLLKSEADHALAARAHVADQIILTTEKRETSKATGAIRQAFRDGRPVLFWSDYEASGLGLAEYILRETALPPLST